MKKQIIFGLLLFFWGVNVKAYTLKFNLEKPGGYEGASVYKIQYKNDGTEELITVNGSYFEYELPEGISNIYVMEQSCDKHYARDYAVYSINYEIMPNFQIRHAYTLKKSKVSWDANYYSALTKEKLEAYSTGLEIYDMNDNLIGEFNESDFVIDSGIYKVIDKTTKKEYVVDWYQESETLELKQYVVNSIKVNNPVKSMCDKNKCYSFKEQDSYLIFDEPIFTDTYLINDKYSILLDINKGILTEYGYTLDIDVPKEENKEDFNDEKNDNIKPDDTPENLGNEQPEDKNNNDEDVKKDEEQIVVNPLEQEIITIDVPNTEIVLEQVIYYVEEKRYNYK